MINTMTRVGIVANATIPMSWSSRQKPKNKRFFVFAGNAYPDVIKGKHDSTTITSDLNDRDSFYNDPVMKLSEHDLDQFNGTEGSPLCIEHDTKAKVGNIYHSWLGTDGSLKVVGRIPLDDASPSELEAIQNIKSGKFTGLSVGYGVQMTSDKITGSTNLDSKNFREISLVKQPFFKGANLAWSVEASRAFNNSDYKTNNEFTDLHLKIVMSGEVTQPQAPASNPQGSTAGSSAAVSPSEMLKQVVDTKSELVDMKSELHQEKQAKDALAQKLAEMEREKEERLKRKAEKYGLQQKPKFEQHVAALTASGVALTDKARRDYEQAYTDIRFKQAAEQLEKECNAMLAREKQFAELQASAAKREAELLALAEKNKEMAEAQNQTAAILASRDNKAAASALSPASQQQLAITASGNARKANNANVPLGHIMCPAPSAAELPLLQENGYRSQVEISASAFTADDDDAPRPYMTSLPAPAKHRMLLNEKREYNLYASARLHSPTLFALMCCSEELRNGDLNDLVIMPQHLNETKLAIAEDWENRHGRAPAY